MSIEGAVQAASELTADAQGKLIAALQDPACYEHHATAPIQHLETHISHLLLTGPFAYKIKKPINLGFLDFGTLEQRRFYCEEEVRLNRRLAPDDYLDVVAIRGSLTAPRINGEGPVLDYAVKMRQFDPDATLDRLDDQGHLAVRHIDAIAAALSEFHAKADSAPTGSNWGSPEMIWAPQAQNLAQLASRTPSGEAQALLEALRTWLAGEHARLAHEFEQRRAHGFVRECHGDLHLGNMVWRDDELLIFDCIEFSPDLRWIDVMSELAFCYMDLLQRGHQDLAARFLNRYLERTGDYAGLTVLRYYAVYRAMVRAKVTYIRARQPGQAADEAGREELLGLAYLRLASALTRPSHARLLITHGLSGSGKTTFSQGLIERLGAICLRSDIERKRLAGLEALARTGAGVEEGIYGHDFSRRTYGHLAYLAERLLYAGWTVLVDATFIARWQRELLRHVAVACHLPFNILDFPLPHEELRQRVTARSAAGRDASEADLDVLEQQLKTQEPLTTEEASSVMAATSMEEVLARLERGEPD
ncbi:MAG TPA: AAA family ATPase [Thiobacillaceae bacterium]|nr:AAA family ATPase [Thiobacillaceae bacterium]